MNFDDFAKNLVVLAEYFNRKLSTAVVQLYYEAVRDIPDDDLAMAFSRAVKECEFFPLAAKLRELAGHGDDEIHLAAVEQWESVLKANQGGTKELNLPPLARKIIQGMGGFYVLGMQSSADFHTHTRRNFLETCKAHLRGNGEYSLQNMRKTAIEAGKSPAQDVLEDEPELIFDCPPIIGGEKRVPKKNHPALKET